MDGIRRYSVCWSDVSVPRIEVKGITMIMGEVQRKGIPAKISEVFSLFL